ncbi:MAG: response regulator [Methylacidiphilales bacterium]|nr:response regulator [Candidatus Methylacidiphilales bacterium]
MQHKIMLVDDDTQVTESLGHLLSDAGFQVIAVEDGETAIEKAHTEPLSLIILDLIVPRMPGFEICKALKNDVATLHIPIIMLSGMSRQSDKITSFELGVDDYVTKPFSPRELILRIKRALGA